MYQHLNINLNIKYVSTLNKIHRKFSFTDFYRFQDLDIFVI